MAFATLLAGQKMLRCTRSSAPIPDDISATLATKVTSPASGGPPHLGSAVTAANAVALALAVELAVDIAAGVGSAPSPAFAVVLCRGNRRVRQTITAITSAGDTSAQGPTPA
jgi:hypothetical protein